MLVFFQHQLESGTKDPLMERPRLVKAFRGLLLGLAVLFVIVGIGIIVTIQEIWVLIISLYFTAILVILERDLVASQKKYLEVKPTVPYREYMRKHTSKKFYISSGIIALILLLIGIAFPEIFWLMFSYSCATAIYPLLHYWYIRKKNSKSI